MDELKLKNKLRPTPLEAVDAFFGQVWFRGFVVSFKRRVNGYIGLHRGCMGGHDDHGVFWTVVKPYLKHGNRSFPLKIDHHSLVQYYISNIYIIMYDYMYTCIYTRLSLSREIHPNLTLGSPSD